MVPPFPVTLSALLDGEFTYTPQPGASMSYLPCRSNAMPEVAIIQMQACPLVGVPATARALTVIVLIPKMPMKIVFLGRLTEASMKPALPAFGPETAGVLMVTTAPLLPSVTPLALEAALAAAIALDDEPL